MDKAKIERLIVLAEECAEVQQVISKIIRHGEFSSHPKSPDITNRDLLESEIRDLFLAVHLLDQEGDIDVERIGEVMEDKVSVDEYLKRKNKYLHFNIIKE